MTRKLACLLACFFPYWAVAQDVTVRAGEHTNFTRVIVDLPDNADWTVGRYTDGYRIRLTEGALFDTRGFFDLIPRDRIRDISISSEPMDLDLRVDCDCHATAFVEDSGWLVVDILDGPPPDGTQFEIFLDGADPSLIIAAFNALESRLTSDDSPDTRISGDEAPRTPALPLPLGLISESNTVRSRPSERPFLESVPFEQAVGQSNQVSTLEAAVVASLNRALSQGLVDSAEESIMTREVLGESPGIDLDSLLGGSDFPLTPGISVTTSIDESRRFPGQTNPDPLPNVNCLPDHMVDVPSWGTTETFSSQISERRGQITSEFDRIDSSAVEALAQNYVYFGFGIEARNALEIDGEKSRARSVLIALSQIMDGQSVDFPGFQRQMGCPGNSAFWGLLAHRDGPFPTEVDSNLVTRVFKTLPEHLQVHLGPRLASKMRQLGSEIGASAVMSSIEKAPDAGIDVALAASDNALNRGDYSDAVAALESLAEEDPRLTPDALVQLVTLKMDQDQPIDQETLALLDVYQFEFKDSQEAFTLYDTHARALVHNGEFLEALNLLQNESAILADGQTEILISHLASKATNNGTDVEFLDLVFDQSLTTIDATSQNAMASRLIDLGFYEKAAGFLEQQTVGAQMTERRYLRAQIAIGLGDRVLAEAHLAGIDTNRAREILSDEIGQSSDIHEGSPELLSSWRSEDWETAAATDETVLSRASSRVLSQPSLITLENEPLARSAALIEDSNDLRATVSELLDRFPTPDSD